MEFIVDGVVLDELELLAVNGFHQAIDATVLTVEKHLGDLAARAIDGLGLQFLVPGLDRHVQPQVVADAVAQPQTVGLSCVEFPVVVLAHAVEAAVLLVTVLVKELDVIVALVLVLVVGVVATPLEFGAHVVLAGRVGTVDRYRALDVLVAEISVELYHGQESECDLSTDGLPVFTYGGKRILLASGDVTECRGSVCGKAYAVHRETAPCAVRLHYGFPIGVEALLRDAAQPDTAGLVLHGLVAIDVERLPPREASHEHTHQCKRKSVFTQFLHDIIL